jgi:hypothetical protein
MATKGNGKAIQWIRDHQAYEHDEWCLMWPFYRLRGYGSFGYLGKQYYAHRFMCTLVHGEPPTPKHQAAHSCGNGHLGCVNPKHLSWKTQSENQMDCRDHGTEVKTKDGNRGRLTMAMANEIRALKGIKTQWQIAEEYRISESSVSDIWLGRTWARPSKIVHWTPEDDAKLKKAISLKMSFRRAAELIGRPVKAVTARAYRLGLRSGYELNKPRNPRSSF